MGATLSPWRGAPTLTGKPWRGQAWWGAAGATRGNPGGGGQAWRATLVGATLAAGQPVGATLGGNPGGGNPGSNLAGAGATLAGATLAGATLAGWRGQPWRGQPWRGQPWLGQPWRGQGWRGQVWRGQPWRGKPGGGNLAGAQQLLRPDLPRRGRASGFRVNPLLHCALWLAGMHQVWQARSAWQSKQISKR